MEKAAQKGDLPATMRRVRVPHILFCLPWLALLSWLASVSWFLTDDAFISFRYVRNLIEGNGLVFNPGEYVEGYSNFLWVLELAALWNFFGARPEQSAQWLSVAYTAGTIIAMLWWIAHSPSLRNRGLVAWMALGLVCSSATFAVWTSGGGLETRQFTFFIVLAVVCLGVHGNDSRGLLTASLSLAAAAYTRPEGLLLAVCCFVWFVVQRQVTLGRPDRRELMFLLVPFVVLVAAHFLFRYGYYGEWLPNTYYAKHVRPWYESGFRYLWAATLETGLYLLISLAVLAQCVHWRERRDGIYALVLLCVVAHLAYLLRIGGDHFEYRPLDFYWPLLAVPAAEGIAHLGSRISAGLQRLSLAGRRDAEIYAVALFLVVLFYASTIQGVLFFEGAAIRERIVKLHIELNENNARWLLAAPGMSALVAISNDLRRQSAAQSVGSPFTEHREFAKGQIRRWKPYENLERGVIPDDALMAGGALGVRFYYLPDLRVIDVLGLTDATVARNPVKRPNHRRVIAHDRNPPIGYLERRGVNFKVYASASSAATALRRANYTLKVGPKLWMPFDAADHQWAIERFVGRDLRMNHFSHTNPFDNQFYYGDSLYVGERLLESFEDGFDGWHIEGEAITNHNQHALYERQQMILGNTGPGFLTSYHPSRGDSVTGRALSPEFTARDDQYLAFQIAGGSGSNVGLRLLVEGKEVAIWRGMNSERFHVVVYPLAAVPGGRFQLELFDQDIGGWGHLMLDHVMLARREVEGGQ